jgi:peptidoglycan/xylan/chitin deacetylase (PgdA/CDA1 family)
MSDDCYVVLLFHSVDDRDLLSFRGLGNIHPDVFEKMLRALKKDFDIMSMEEIAGCIAANEKRSGKLLAITFDDGPKSYASRALPLLETLGIPSTCFLITDCVGDRAIYWRYLYNFCIHGGHESELAGIISAEYGRAMRPEEIIGFTRGNFTKEKNERIIRGIFERMVAEEKYRDEEQGLFLSPEDIELAKRNPLVSFGIHTRTHPVMMQLSNDEIMDELSGSTDFYRAGIKDETPMFSVPFGRLYKDYDDRTIIAARGLSIKVILSAYGGGNHRGQPLFNIRRIPVREEMLEGGIGSFRRIIESLCKAEEYAGAERRLYDVIERDATDPNRLSKT